MGKIRGFESEKALPKRGRRWGRLMVYQSKYGWIVKTSPSYSSPGSLRAIRSWTNWLRIANILFKYTAPEVLVEFQRQAKLARLPARDLWMSSMNGLLLVLVDQDGKEWYSMAHVERISKSLDVFTRTKGAILFRGDEVWTALSPGSDGDVLTIVNGVPAWLPQVGSGGGFVVHHFPASALDGSFSWRGIGWEGYSFIRMDNTSSHYIRLGIPVHSSLNDFRLDTTLYLPQVAVGDVVFRLTLYNRVVWPMTMVYTGDFVFTLNHRDYSAVPASFLVSGFSNLQPGDLVVDLRRNPSDSRNTYAQEIYIAYVRVLVR